MFRGRRACGLADRKRCNTFSANRFTNRYWQGRHVSVPTVLSVCGDPGGARAVAAVIRLLEFEQRVNLVNYAYNQATGILKHDGIKLSLLPDQADENRALRCLGESGASFLLTGTSHNGVDWEKSFVSSARQLGIRSLAVLDFWSSYAARFSDEHGRLAYVPDQVAVMDERARIEAIAAGIPERCITVTGQPAFDSLAECRRQFSRERRSSIRASLGIEENSLLVLFASQPIRKIYGKDTADPRHPGFVEGSVIHGLIAALEMICRKSNRRITLILRPHPRETHDEFSRYRSSVIDVIVSDEGDRREYAMSSDLVVGMNSILLVEACYLSCVVVSLQPGLHGNDTLPTNAWGTSVGVYRESEIGAAIEKMLLNTSARNAIVQKASLLKLDATATRCVADHIYAVSLGSGQDKNAPMKANERG